jgi:hypothetical protein
MSEAIKAKCEAALARASNPQSMINMATVIEAAARRGLADARPGENVLTFNAWKARGRVVIKGEKALCSLPVIGSRDVRDPATGETETRKMAFKAAVFHVSQTKPLEG